jgi:citrate synthase
MKAVLNTNMLDNADRRRHLVTIYRAQELCRRHSFEEIAYLCWHGELPTREQVSAQNRLERAQRALAPRVTASLARQPLTADPMDTLRTALAEDGTPVNALAAAVPAKVVRLFAVLPSIVAADQRLRQGLGVISPREHLGYAANFLAMTFGKVPEPQIVAAFETALILYAGDIPLTSAFPSRPANPQHAVGSAIDAVRRSEDRGAGRAILKMVNEVGIPDNASSWVEEALAGGRKIPGFNYHLDKTDDARVPAMRGALGMIAGLRRGRHLIDVYEALAAAVHEATGRTPLLDYPASLAFHLIGFEAQAFAPILAITRLPGWTAPSARQPAVSSLIWPRPAADARTAEAVARVR